MTLTQNRRRCGRDIFPINDLRMQANFFRKIALSAGFHYGYGLLKFHYEKSVNTNRNKWRRAALSKHR